jgi:hypothetical protein
VSWHSLKNEVKAVFAQLKKSEDIESATKDLQRLIAEGEKFAKNSVLQQGSTQDGTEADSGTSSCSFDSLAHFVSQKL